jgi:hypothetical protein
MRQQVALPAACAAVLAVAPVLAQQAPVEKPQPGREAVPPGAKPGNFTADEARQKIEAAGWHDVAELRNGHGEVWHALATKGGLRVRVVLLPNGRVAPED